MTARKQYPKPRRQQRLRPDAGGAGGQRAGQALPQEQNSWGTWRAPGWLPLGHCGTDLPVSFLLFLGPAKARWGWGWGCDWQASVPTPQAPEMSW